MEILRTIATYVLVHAKSMDEACTLYSATNVADKGKKKRKTIFMIKIKEEITYIYLTFFVLHEPIDNYIRTRGILLRLATRHGSDSLLFFFALQI